MELLPWLTSGAAMFLAAVALLLLNYFFVYHRRLNRPPGPRPWPIIGNLDLIVGPLPHRSFHQLSQKYGPIIQLYAGSAPIIVASSVEMAKLFLKTHDVNFASRSKSAAGKYTAYDHTNIIWAPYGPYWRLTRKICLHELFTVRRLNSNEYIRTQELMAIISNIYASCGKRITLREPFSNYTFNSVSRMVLGTKDFGSKSSEFRNMLDEWEYLNGAFNIGDFIPLFNFLDLQGLVKQMKALQKKIDHFLEHIIDEHISKQGSKDFASEDVVDVLLKLVDDPNLEVKFSKSKIKAIIQDLLVAPNPATATVEWAMSALLKHPEMMERATAEIDEVIGKNRWVEEKDILHLPYLEAVTKETMRIHTPAPILPYHTSQADCKVAGYDIPAGTRVVVSPWSIARDPTLWDAPDEFRPERFIGSDIDVKGHHLELLPFGAGRRMCPGYSVALKMVQTGLANLLHGFNWKLADDTKPGDLNMDETYGDIKKIPLVVVPQPRLPSHLYPQ